MSQDQFSEVTHDSWVERIKNSLVGVMFGLVLFVGAFPLLFWNEGRAVKRYRTLAEGEGAVVSVFAETVDPANEGLLVHVSGTADTRDTLADDDFDIFLSALRLKRKVEIYQWRERKETRTEKKIGGGKRKVTRYTYSKVWSASLIPSAGFKRRSGHENPSSTPFASDTFDAPQVFLGAFTLSQELVRKIDNWEPVAIDDTVPLPAVLEGRAVAYGDGYYLGQDPDAPAIGDVRITYAAVFPGPVSLVAAQEDSMLATYRTRSDGTIGLVQTGDHSAEEMFKTARDHNRLLTWVIRAGGLLLIFIGLVLLANPLTAIAGSIPLAGSFVAAGTWLVAFVLALVLGSMVIGVAWVFYRPLMGLSLMAGAVILVAGMILKGRGRGEQMAVPASPPKQQIPDRPAARPPAPEKAPSPPPPPGHPPRPPKPIAAEAMPPKGRTFAGWMKTAKKAFAAGRYKEAAAAFEKAVVLDPVNGVAFFNLGVAYKKTGATGKALLAFKKAARRGHQKAMSLLASQNIDW